MGKKRGLTRSLAVYIPLNLPRTASSIGRSHGDGDTGAQKPSEPLFLFFYPFSSLSGFVSMKRKSPLSLSKQERVMEQPCSDLSNNWLSALVHREDSTCNERLLSSS